MRIALIVLIVILAGIIIFGAGSYAYFNRPTSCATCHVMKDYVSSWQKTKHARADVDCYSCHAQPGIRGRIGAHAQGLRYVVTYWGKPKLKADVANDTCFRCHFTYSKQSKNKIASNHYKSYLKKDVKCVDCHLQLAHGTANKKKLPKTIADGWAGVDVCKKCHEPQFKAWSEEALHPEAMQVLMPKMVTNKNCLPCHTVGFNKGGFVSLEKTPKLAAVQCESCHGKGENHIARPKAENAPDAGLNAEACGVCHTGPHHDTFSEAEWKGTKHARALPDLLKFRKIKPEAVKDYCLECHSTDYRLAPADKKPTLDTAKLSLTCQACHDTHSTLTRLPKNLLCQSCHTGGLELKVGGEVHNNTKEMYFGKIVPGTGIFAPPVFAKHVRSGVGCPECHMFKKPYVSEAEPAKSGHDFLPKPEGCAVCHPERGVDGNKAMIDTLQAPTKAALAELKPRIDAAKVRFEELKKAGKATKDLTKVYNLAIFGYDFTFQDRSNGFHNPDYAKAMLDLSRKNLAAFEAQSR